ncbi:TetR/AcrR family transcriptional regulator [Frankia sp. CNm7]|uniref:TetR/AcrR family transcriptional regulator n=1 Tax=Frankia nepalensis TaxID=1836974 RepID=A0A937UQT4_9ACTN|nr:TetR/AcrR family transcriptional regulator [Frankia nepalensis]MBL7497154.1 TetR/AcrR family transcriptional regulator [Frankia nepalensis]MBL7514003.1 TetR/AcrR family transcriptional regulator [Frankia nepalensis]MBL7521401.1 TetR/AcrR family transcriptional regulator [Frankia nepalensis]MBL7627046.1 TetR/AcrR family transcriptional regulator [Frankia nepalensis]
MSNDGARRAEILDAAATLFASTGVRTTLKDVADACGILPGSLYHHFESKEAIIVELVRRYQTALDDVAHAALEELGRPSARPPAEIIVSLGEAIAACAIRHRAALLLSFYEPPAGSSEELVQLAARTPTLIQTATREALRAGRERGYLRPGVDLAMLADRLCQSMLHVGIGVSHRTAGGNRMAAIRCRILLDGLAVSPPPDDALEQSPAFLAANKVVATWDEDDDGVDERDREGLIRATARAEFARRGYEATTVRDIAAAAGLSTGSVYRVIESKERLLISIMASYVATVTAGWRAVLRSPSTAVEKLDALMWFDINLMDQFSEEFKIQFAGLRESPPDSPDLTWTFPTQLRQVKTLLAEGIRAGDLHLEGASADIRARCLFGVIWMPQNIVHGAGARAALALSRDTVLRGASDRSAANREPFSHARTGG